MTMLRPAGAADIDVILSLQTASWRSTYRGILDDDFLDHRLEATLRDHWDDLIPRLTERDFLRIGERDGSPTGFICTRGVDDPPGLAYLENIHVSAQARGSGLGRQLMRAAGDHLQRHAFQSLYLWVAAANRDARHFYARLGGVECPPDNQDLFGNRVPAVRVDWPDLSAVRW